MRSRRSYLAVLGALGTLSLSGCLGSEETAPTTPTTSTAAGTTGETASPEGSPSGTAAEFRQYRESLTISDREQYHATHPGVVFADETELDPAAGDGFEIENVQTDVTLSVVPSASVTLGAQAPVRMLLYGADGSLAESPKLIQKVDDRKRYPVRLSRSVADVFDRTAPSIRIRYLSGGETKHETETRRVVVGYSGLLQQSGTSGEIELWVPRQGLPEGLSIEGRLDRDGREPFTFGLDYAQASDRFTTVADTTALRAGTYDWELECSLENRTLFRFGTYIGDREFEAIPKIEITT
ncbi:hypothetical protein [Halorientalis halophila]|uniref:hypothetical protein n=1 Tax=Halorientalis halophila TaxID=3108499 RepID=UPI00300B5995